MSLRNAMLAILIVGPMSGYDLQKRFSDSVGHVWHASDSQIYPELKKMAGEGLIVAEEQARGERGMRRVYHVTDEGQKYFTDWMNAQPDYQRTRDAAHLRAAYLEWADPGAAREFLKAHIAHWKGELEAWETEIHHFDTLNSPILAKRLSVTAPEDHEKVVAYKRFAYEGLATRARTEIAWAEEGLALIDRIEG